MSGPHMLKLDTKPSPDSSGPPSLIDPLPKTESGDVPYEHLESLHVDLTSKGMLKLYVVWIIAFQATFLAGYSIAGMTAINAMPTFQRYFDFDGLGVNVGLVFSMWPIAACLTFWAGPILADRLGRRGGMFVCALIFLAGTAMIAGARNLGMLLAGRFLCGSMGMMQPSSAPYIVELSPPHARGMLTGLFNVCFGELDRAVTWDKLTDIVIGQIVCTCISIGTSNIKSDWAWRSILVIQLAIPAIMASAVLFLPESPRWLYANGQREKAQAVLMKYHGNGELTALVRLEMRQIGDSVATMPKRWDYGTLFKTRSARYRVMLALFMAVAQQLSGQGLNHFLPVIYKQVGVTSVQKQLIMTLIAAIVTLVAALLGTYNSDRLGRRKMLIGGTSLCALALTGAMISSAYAHVNTDGSTVRGENFNSAASKASIAILILLGACYGWGYMPLLPLYPSEVLRTEQRSTGMGLVVLGVNLASFINQFLIPIALKQIGWWTYLPFIIWVCIETVLWYLFAVETKGRTLEELDEIFDSPKPVKASLLARNHQHKPSDLTKPQDLEKAATGAPLQVAVSGGP